MHRRVASTFGSWRGQFYCQEMAFPLLNLVLNSSTIAPVTTWHRCAIWSRAHAAPRCQRLTGDGIT